MRRRRSILIGVLFSVAAFSLIASARLGTIFLPGTQPGVVETFDSPLQCLACHQGENSGVPVTIGSDWAGSMMGHSARDPIFYAAVAIANKYRDGSGEFCLRCHSPGGWLEGRSDPPTGEGLNATDRQGVQCDACHRLKDPSVPDTTADPPVPGAGNGMMVMQVPLYPKRGPFSDAFQFHETVQDSFQVASEFCGTCHNVSNPFYADDPVTQSPHEYSPIERTYSEWLLSSYPSLGEEGTCQSCHMPRLTGYGCIVQGAPLRENIPQHDLTGGNTFVPDILHDFWGSEVDTAALRRGRDRAAQTLRRAALLDFVTTRIGDTLIAEVTVANLTGHKLPTGYPEGRRMWLSVFAMDEAGDTLFRSGAYNDETGELPDDPQLKVYEVRPGLTAQTADVYGLEPGPSFHFILNDTIYFDNRIPPSGFTNAAFAGHHAAPVGYHYDDFVYWDRTTYRIPGDVSTLSVLLYYQTASREYITFLRDENTGNPFDWNAWGDSLYTAWERNGKSRPAIIDSITLPVVLTGVPGGRGVPEQTQLDQNYPNPFNPSTTIRFTLGRSGPARIVITDLLGREVAVPVSGYLEAGEHRALLSADGWPSGVYFYSLYTGEDRITTKKLILMK